MALTPSYQEGANATSIVAILVLLIAVGVGVAIVGVAPAQLVAITSLAAIPLILWATVRVPALVVGVIAFSQILEGFELQTPVGTISPGIVALMVFLGLRLPETLAIGGSRMSRLGAACLVAYVAGHGFQFLHSDAGLAARSIVTASSFAAFVLLGMYVGVRRSHFAGAAVGGAIGVLVLAGMALAANLGLIPLPSSYSPGREILGVTSPFLRNFGIDTANIGFLLALCVPWLALATRPPSATRVRFVASAVLVLIWLARFSCSSLGAWFSRFLWALS